MSAVSAPKSSLAKKAAPPPPKMTDQEINQMYQRHKNNLQEIAQKIGELESEAEEHTLVLQTLLETQTLDPTRKCFRMIGGVLVERTVKEVVPSLETNNAGIRQVLETLIGQYKSRETEFEEFCKENGIQRQGVQRS
ncbi:Prefoldin subunit-domain-containing protein [Mrakia frigida]|uniref:tubulin-binding prefolding complex subunit GIM4 n=1 Tax=Mrakia frigida TaxID=29902 RepID=UPI003FCC0C47